MTIKHTTRPLIPAAAFTLLSLSLVRHDLHEIDRRHPARVEEEARPVRAYKNETIGVSLHGALRGMRNQFPRLEIRGTNSPAQSWYASNGVNGGARIELTGDAQNLTSAKLLLAMPDPYYVQFDHDSRDPQAILRRNVTLLLTFIRNTFPESKGAAEWEWALDTALETMRLRHISHITHGNRTIRIEFNQEQNRVQILVMHA